MLESFFERFIYFEDLDRDYLVRLIRLEWRGEDLALDLAIHEPYANEDAELWTIVSRSPIGHCVSLDGAEFSQIEVADDHVLSWPFVQPSVNVLFKGAVSDPLSLAGALSARHQQLVGSWLPERFYLPPKVGVGGVPSGSLCVAPEQLALAYAQVLESYGCGVSLLYHHPVPDVIRLWALTLGDSYIVAEGFEASNTREQ